MHLGKILFRGRETYLLLLLLFLLFFFLFLLLFLFFLLFLLFFLLFLLFLLLLFLLFLFLLFLLLLLLPLFNEIGSYRHKSGGDLSTDAPPVSPGSFRKHEEEGNFRHDEGKCGAAEAIAQNDASESPGRAHWV